MNMPLLDKVYLQVDFDRDLVFKFFTIFSIFEYALKKAGFCISGRSGEAQPDWKGFANSIQPHFNSQSKPSLFTAVSYLLNRPVMKQVIRNNSLFFIQRRRPSNMNDTTWLSVLIRGVRNNLFHGGKYRYDRPRDPELIKSSLNILESWAWLNPEVKQELINVQ